MSTMTRAVMAARPILRISVWLFLAIALFIPTIAFAAPRVEVTPSSFMSGQTITVTGTGWAPYDQIIVTWTDPDGNIVPIGFVLADQNGNFRQSQVIPPNLKPGQYQIDGNGRGGTVSAAVSVLATPTATPLATATLAPTPVPTGVAILPPFAGLPTATPTPSPTPSPTSTPTPTFTPTQTPTPTPTFTSTSTPTPTPTNTPTVPEQIVQTTRSLDGFGIIGGLLIGGAVGYWLGLRRSASAIEREE